WSLIQGSLSDRAELDSNLRLGILYLLALSGVITVLTTASIVVHIVITQLLGQQRSFTDFIHELGGPVSIGVPLGVVWAYYSHWLNRHIEAIGDPVRQAAMKRAYRYVLSALGLGGAFVGVATLIKFMIHFLTGGSLSITDPLRSQLATGISLVVAWLPLWVATWRPLQAQAFAADDTGDHARRSIVRRGYLYLALFAGVVGGMASAVALIYQLLNSALGGGADSNFLADVLNDLQLLALFAVLLLYHLNVLRRDGGATADTLAKKQGDFKLVVVDSGSGFTGPVRAALAKAAPNVPVVLSTEKPQDSFDALIVSGSRLLDAPDWVREFAGSRIVVPDEAPGLIWPGGVSEDAVQQAAQAVRQLAEGQPVHEKAGGSGWRVVIYIAAALFGAELLLGLLGVVISTFVR
ncbi:MAG: DUF5671 domain-containing protein, partial [Anaerolineae bacterium]